MHFLHGHGPWLGLPALRGTFPDLPRAELRALLRLYRHLWSVTHPRWRQLLHWLRPGAVWAMDFTQVTQPIDGLYPYVFAVRDLASGFQLAWQPVPAPTGALVQAELTLLATVYGAPLVLKSDNGSAFCADPLQAWFRRWQVWPLSSPPGRPGYNGAIEASIGWLKKWTAHQADCQGHPGVWTSEDLTRARTLTNDTARPRGVRGPTPLAAWEERRSPTDAERAAWSAAVRRLETCARQAAGLAVDAVLSHDDQAALHRRVLPQALVEGGLLTIERRRLPQRFFGQIAAEIW